MAVSHSLCVALCAESVYKYQTVIDYTQTMTTQYSDVDYRQTMAVSHSLSVAPCCRECLQVPDGDRRQTMNIQRRFRGGSYRGSGTPPGSKKKKTKKDMSSFQPYVMP